MSLVTFWMISPKIQYIYYILLLQWPVTSENRASRCTGAALSIAVSLLESCFPRSGARIMTFIGGACTIGPGMVLGNKLSEEMRSHTDIKKGNAKHLQAATQFYDELAQRCIKNLHTIDLFACALDQVGLLEMHSCVEKTGGLVVLADSMKVSMFKESFRRVFSKFGEDAQPEEQKYLAMGFGASCDILTSKEYQVEGCIGPCYSLNVKGPCVSDTVLGEGGTTSWYLGSLDTQTTLAFYFDVNNTSSTPISPSQPRCLQIITRYQHSNGKNRIRVTTSMAAWNSDPSNNISVSCSFDQECATALMARIAAHRTQEEDAGDVLRWLDRSLIRLIAKFADYRPNDPNSLKLSNEFNFYPQFMFHLRRSQFLESLNCSPDESTYNRMMLERQNTRNSLVMIQPALLSYSFQGSPIPVLLDVTSVRADAILLLDTFFHVVIFYGSTMAQWRDAGYQNQPEHANFKKLLEQPQEHAQEIMGNRFPVPRFILCDQYKSQSRFLMAKLNPSITHRNVDGAHAPVFTDDVSLSVFMEHLKKIAVQQ